MGNEQLFGATRNSCCCVMIARCMNIHNQPFKKLREAKILFCSKSLTCFAANCSVLKKILSSNFLCTEICILNRITLLYYRTHSREKEYACTLLHLYMYSMLL